MSILGFKFPFTVGTTSFPEEAVDEDVIKSSIIQILSTGYGERIMRPDFGCRSFDYVFENDNELLQVMIERDVRSALYKWEPRIRVESLTVESDQETSPGVITINIVYTVLSSNQLDSLTISGGR